MLIPQSNLVSVFALTKTFDPASVAAATSAEQDITVTGVKVGDVVLAVNKPSATAGIGVVNARVKAADTISVTLMNATAGALDPASETWTFVIARPEATGTTMNV